MDLLRNLISQFHKSRKSPGNQSNPNTSNPNSIDNDSQKQPNNTTLQSNIDVKANITEAINACNDKDTPENTDTKTTEEYLYKKSVTHDDNKSINTSDLRLIERLLDNTSVTTVKIINSAQSGAKNTKTKAKNSPSYDKNKNIVKLVNVASLFHTKHILYNNTIYIGNISEVLDKGLANQNKAANITNDISDSTGSSTEIEKKMNEQTIKHLKEFDEVLAEVKKRHDSVGAEALSLDDIEEIISNDGLEDDGSTYSFQEIKYTVANNDWNEETKYVMKSNITFIGQILESIVSNSYNEAVKFTKEDDLDVISISSDDAAYTDEVKNDNVEVAPNKIENSAIETNLRMKVNIKNEKVFQPKEAQIVDTISITSEDDNETDDGGYHSSDFEFISEEEAKLGGLITNFKRHIKFDQKTNAKEIEGTNRVQNEPYGPGPSRNGYNYYKRDRKVIVDKSYMKNYAIPQDNEFVNMFHGVVPGLSQCEIRFLENKSVRTRAPMLVQYEGLGFDMHLAMQRVDSSDEEYREEAQESLKKILEMYPDENTKKRKRRRRH